MATFREDDRAMTTKPTASKTPTATAEPSEPTGSGGPDGTTDADPRAALHAAFLAAGPVLAAAENADPALPTPCDEFTVGDLLAHLNSVGLRIARMGHGGPALDVPDATIEPDGRYAEAWARHRADVAATWDQLAPDAEVVAPWGALPVVEAASIYAAEVVVHTWDLAVAVGVPFSVDDDLAEVGIAAIARELPPEARADIYAAIRAQVPDDFGWTDPFGAAVTVAEGASALDRLVAISGRSPNWPGT
jgi:uncharacterized protein (TIGR03086 family)